MKTKPRSTRWGASGKRTRQCDRRSRCPFHSTCLDVFAKGRRTNNRLRMVERRDFRSCPRGCTERQNEKKSSQCTERIFSTRFRRCHSIHILVVVALRIEATPEPTRERAAAERLPETASNVAPKRDTEATIDKSRHYFLGCSKRSLRLPQSKTPGHSRRPWNTGLRQSLRRLVCIYGLPRTGKIPMQLLLSIEQSGRPTPMPGRISVHKVCWKFVVYQRRNREVDAEAA